MSSQFWMSVNMKKRQWSFIAHVRLVAVRLKRIYIVWRKRKASRCLKGTTCHHSEPANPSLRNMFLLFDRSCRWADFVWICHPLPALPFIYLNPTSVFPFTLHVSPAPSFILPSSISLFFIFLCHSLRPFDSPPRSVRGRPPVLTASYLTFSPLLWSNRRPSHTKSYRFTWPRADSSTSGRGWLHLQTSGHNGSVRPAAQR